MKRYYDRALTIRNIAKEYGVDPWVVAHEWSLERFDFNLNISIVAAMQEEKANKQESMRQEALSLGSR